MKKKEGPSEKLQERPSEKPPEKQPEKESVKPVGKPVEPIDKSAKVAASEGPTNQIIDVVQYIQRIDVDEEVALATMLDEEGEFFEAYDVVQNFEDLTTLELERERVYRWRN